MQSFTPLQSYILLGRIRPLKLDILQHKLELCQEKIGRFIKKC